MITRKQVADLHPGDVVRVDFGDGSYLQGPLRNGRLAELLLSPFLRLRRSDGSCRLAGGHTLTVISRAPSPLYVNHHRTEPAPGDVVRDADGHAVRTWMYCAGGGCPWLFTSGERGLIHGAAKREVLPARLRLLVDGATGMTVPS